MTSARTVVLDQGIRVNAVAPGSSYITGTVLPVMGGETSGGCARAKRNR